MRNHNKDFPGDLVLKLLSFYCRDTRLIPGWGTMIPHAMHCSQKKNFFNKRQK